LSLHKLQNNKCCSKIILKRGDYSIELIEHYPCANKKEAHAREGFWIRNNECINKYVPGRTMKEYRQKHGERISKYNIEVRKWLKSWDGSSRRRGLNQIAIDLFD